MWITQEGVREEIKSKDGTIWFFKYWHDAIDKTYTQRIFFWDSEKKTTGLVQFKDDQNIHLRQWKDRAIKLSKDKSYREKFLCELKFPIENHY